MIFSLSRKIKIIKHQLSISRLPSNLTSFSQQQLFGFLYTAVQNSEVLDVRNQSNPSIAFLQDPRSYTLLHVSTFNNQPKIVDMLLEYEKEISSQEVIKKWVNQLNNDAFSAFHFAAYRGSIRILELLKNQEADINTVNQQGQNAFQIAAQGDQVLAMVWLKQNNVDMLHRDEKGGTALHWSSFYGSEFSIQFLLSWIKDENIINIQDQDGMTALHLAAMTGNIRIVKKLMLRGANKDLKDSKDQTPADLAEEGQYQGIVQLFMDSNCFLEFLNIKTSFKRLEKSIFQPFLFCFLYLFSIVGTVVFVYPFLYNYIIIYISTSLFLIGFILYIWAFFSDGGKIKKKESLQDLFNLVQSYEPWEVCPECVILKPKRSRHCEICQQCIKCYDHHCPWINNCVRYEDYNKVLQIGANNHGIFIVFLLFLVFNLVHTGVLNAIFLIDGYDDVENKIFSWLNKNTNETVFILKIVVINNVIIMLDRSKSQY